jgi:hypothetical protein
MLRTAFFTSSENRLTASNGPRPNRGSTGCPLMLVSSARRSTTPIRHASRPFAEQTPVSVGPPAPGRDAGRSATARPETPETCSAATCAVNCSRASGTGPRSWIARGVCRGWQGRSRVEALWKQGGLRAPPNLGMVCSEPWLPPEILPARRFPPETLVASLFPSLIASLFHSPNNQSRPRFLPCGRSGLVPSSRT